MPRHGMPHGCRCTRTLLGAPPTPRFGVSEARFTNPGRKNAPRERDGLFDIVRWVETRCCPHPEERACASASAKSNARARVSKDEDGHGMALMLRDASQRPESVEASVPARAAMLLSMRARARSTNLRLQETIAGSVSLFPACSLQGTPQLKRVGPSAGARVRTTMR